MTVETVETTDDPMVAALYGAMAFPSLRPGVTTAVDLVAGQTGPWPLLADPDRARLAADLVDRLRNACSSAAADPVAMAVGVVEACELAAGRLSAVWAEHRDMPADLRHDVEALEQRLVDFIAGRRGDIDRLADTTGPSPVAAAVTEPARDGRTVLPELDEAEGWRLDQWLALIRSRGLSTTPLVEAMADGAIALGKEPPTRIKDVTLRPYLVPLLLEAIEAATR